MPSTIGQVFALAGLEPDGVVRWRMPVPSPGRGVYVVALTNQLDTTDGALSEPPVSRDAIAELLEARPDLTVDGKRPDVGVLGRRLAAFWLPDEVLLYIGLAGTSLATRIDQYYRTPLGARSPHAGGWFLKSLSVLGELHVHYATCSDPDGCEDGMLAGFSAAVSEETASGLHDPDRPIPFANLEWPKRRYKKHGIKGAKERRIKRGGRSVPRAEAPRSEAPVRASLAEAGHRTQRVTAADIRAGRIRIPRGSTKQLFPMARDDIEVELRGERFSARWDPRYGRDQERSGVIGIGRDRLARLVEVDEVLRVSAQGRRVLVD